MLRYETAGPQKQALLSSLMQKYLYEMTAWYDDPMGEDGNYPYPWLPYYFTEAARQAFLFYNEEDRLVGFALVNTHSFLEEPADSCLAEFCVFPAFRHRGYAMQMLQLMTEARPGTWQLKFSPGNPPGAALWRRVARERQGTLIPIEGNEIVLRFQT